MLVPANKNAKLSWLARLGRTRIWGQALTTRGKYVQWTLKPPMSAETRLPRGVALHPVILHSGFSTEASGSLLAVPVDRGSLSRRLVLFYM